MLFLLITTIFSCQCIICSEDRLSASNINAPIYFGEQTYLHIAAKCGNLSEVQRLLRKKASPNIHNAWGETPLQLAAVNWFPSVIQALLKAGAHVNSRDSKDRSALLYAVMLVDPQRLHIDQIETIELLLKAGAHITTGCNEHLNGLLMHIIHQCNLPTPTQKHLIHPSKKECPGASIGSLSESKLGEKIQLAISKKENLNSSWNKAQCPLNFNGYESYVHATSMQKSPELLRVVLEHGGTPHKHDLSSSPLPLAAIWECYENVRLLIEKGASPNDDANLWPPLLAALRTFLYTPFGAHWLAHGPVPGNRAIISFLMNHGANPDYPAGDIKSHNLLRHYQTLQADSIIRAANKLSYKQARSFIIGQIPSQGSLITTLSADIIQLIFQFVRKENLSMAKDPDQQQKIMINAALTKSPKPRRGKISLAILPNCSVQ